MSNVPSLTVGGSTVDLSAFPLGPVTLYVRGGVPSLVFYQRGGALPGLPDPFVGAAFVFAIDGTIYLQGDVVGCHPEFNDRLGWVLAYSCLGLRHRGDLVPLTDDNTGMDTAAFNLDPTDTNYIASRAGRTVGQVLTDVLTMVTNATNLDTYGLGAYTSLTPPALPSDTVADLAAMTVVPPTPLYVSGQKCLGAIEGFLDQYAPNHGLWIDPATGALRFLDMRTFTAHTFTMDSDPVEPTPLARDVGDCFQRVLVRGQPVVEPFLLSLSNGQLLEDFTSAEKTAFSASAYNQQQGAAQDTGTCTCPSTTTITVTSADASETWGADFWDQTGTGAHGIVTALDPGGSGITMIATRRIVSNTALSAGGTSTLTLDLPLPITSYSQYTIFGNYPSAVAYQLYKASDTTIGAALQNQFAYPVPFVSANGAAASLTSVPCGSVVYGSGPAYNEFPLPFTQDPGTGTFRFVKPTFLIASNSDPHDVRVLAAVATGVNQVVSPADISGVPQYAGTSHTVDGLTNTLVVTIPAWKDPLNATAMAAYAADLLDSVKDARVEGAITCRGLFTGALTMGTAASVAISGGTTGWESLAAPIVECSIEVPDDSGEQWRTVMRCSNLRNATAPSMFLKPDRIGFAVSEGVIGSVIQAAGLTSTHGWAGAVDSIADHHQAMLGVSAESALSAPQSLDDLGLSTDPGSFLQSQGLYDPFSDTPGENNMASARDRAEQRTRTRANAQANQDLSRSDFDDHATEDSGS